MSSHHGVLVLHKQGGMTSNDCVNQVRRLFQTKKAGHTGTLDPDVSGVLPICLGNATRIVEYLQELPKSYEAVLRLGVSTTTEDASGEIIEEKTVPADQVTEERVSSVFHRFLGDIQQIPPMYSAVKVGGKRLYDLARQGEVIERKPRGVKIYDLSLHSITRGEHVDISFSCRCSKGTYIRTLCVDIGRELGYPAHMARLVRTGSGPFTLADTVTIEQINSMYERGEDISSLLIPITEALSFLPRIDVPSSRKQAVLNGLETALPGVDLAEGSLVRLFSENQLLGLHRVCIGSKGAYAKAEKVFPYEVGM